MVKRLGLLHFAKPSNYFYPIPFRDASLFSTDEQYSFDKYFSRALTSHLWNEVLRHKGQNKNVIFPKDSPYERMITMSALDSDGHANSLKCEYLHLSIILNHLYIFLNYCYHFYIIHLFFLYK